jgi:hypothetical protein
VVGELEHGLQEQEPFLLASEDLWVNRLAFERHVAEWETFHEPLPSLFVSRTGLRSCEAIRELISSSRPPTLMRKISRASQPNEKGAVFPGIEAQ